MAVICRKGCRSKYFFLLFISSVATMVFAVVIWKESTPQWLVVGSTAKSGATTIETKLDTTGIWKEGTPQRLVVGSTAKSSTTTIETNLDTTGTPITMFLRMSGKKEDHRYRFYCDLFRTTVLYWPPSYGKIVMVLDEESELDHIFGEKTTRKLEHHFPEYKFEVMYEALPEDNSVLNFSGMARAVGYNRQLWSSFFIDLYTNDPIIAWMDNDAAFITPVTKSSIFNGTKLRVLGWDCSFQDSWIRSWERTAELALGLPMVVDFMTYFPVYIYRDTFTNCREYILKHHNTSNFGKAFRNFYVEGLSPVSVVLSYAWYFERDRYDWNFELCSNLAEFNKRFPVGHSIGPEHIEYILSEPQTAFHVPYADLFSQTLTSYCLLHEVTGNKMDICSKENFSLNDNFVLLHHDLQRVKSARKKFQYISDPNCGGDNAKICLQVLERHYKQVALEVKQNGRKVDWHNVEKVEKLAKEEHLTCDPMA